MENSEKRKQYIKTYILFILNTIVSFNCYSQITFENGYYINNANQKINCLINNVDWKNNPTAFDYKLSENSEPKRLTIKSVKEFGIHNISKYVRSTVNIDRSSEDIDNLSTVRNPIFNEEELFLKVLVDGKPSLYQYTDGKLSRYFYEKNNSDIEQLIFKSYKIDGSKIGRNNRFRQQLLNNLKCSNFSTSKIQNLGYSKNELVNLFIDYHNCNNQEYINFEKKQKRDLFNLTFRPRLNSSSLVIQNSSPYIARNTDFDSKIGFGFGIEAELILPFNKNKWGIAIEPTYRSYKSQKTTTVDNVSGGILTANVNYNSIEVPVSLRHYFFINTNSKIFINTSYLMDFSSKSSIEFTRNDGSSLSSLNIKTRNNIAFGIGYKHNDKYSLEIRLQTNREVLGDYTFWSSEYKTSSIIFGYSLF